MAKRSSVRLSMDKMEQLLEGLKTTPVLQIGVFADKAARTGGGTTNAAIARAHEFGVPERKIPPRSFLRMPLKTHTSEVMAPLKGLQEAFISGRTKIEDAWRRVGVAAVAVVTKAFGTGGYGQWPPLKEATVFRKMRGSLAKRKRLTAETMAGKHGMGILVDTGQLRRSITFRLKMVSRYF